MSAEPAVWGVHDEVPSYKITVNRAGQPTRVETDEAGTGPSGCGWYRIILPLRELGKHGWKTQWRAGAPPQGASERVIVAQRLDKPGVLPLWRQLRLRHKLVYETDDDIFSVPPWRWRWSSYPKAVMHDTVEHAAMISDIVTVTTEPLAEVYRGLGHPDVRVLPNCIPEALFTLDRNRHHRKVVVGWGGGGSHQPDVEMIASPLREVMDRHAKRAELHMMGSDFTRECRLKARVTPWIRVEESLNYYRQVDFDIGLAPVTGTDFDRSKSNIKALEYMAYGIPVLASDCEPYRGTVIDGVNGYLCRTPGDWSRRLNDLISDQAMREEMGAKGREMARSRTIEANWQRWAEVYADLL